MAKVLKLNSISPKINEVLDEKYEVSSECLSPDLILVRSAQMADYEVPESLIAVGRAGAGVNNIPVKEYAEKGIAVFNAPGANANAVKELVIAALLLSCRKIVEGIGWANSLKPGDGEVKTLVEKGKSRFVGGEILGKNLGVIGLGAIGKKVAVAADALGMTVYGYDPYCCNNDFCKDVVIADSPDEIYKNCDFITLHVPFLPDTKGFINEKTISKMKDGVAIINCARGELVVNADIIAAVKSGKVSKYFTDFPTEDLLNVENVVACPHLGASTPEAEDNCAVMVARQLKDFYENGNVVNSVNCPALTKEKNGPRVTVFANDTPKTESLIAEVANDNNAETAIAKKGATLYAIIDGIIPERDVERLKAADGILRVRVL